MRRADRLFDIVQILRRGKIVRAQDMAEVLEVSERTIYRDIASLIGSGVPVEGEAGVGYMLRDQMDLPPLMFNEEEIEAVVLGIRMVESWADHALARSARSALRKIEAVLPADLQASVENIPVNAPSSHWAEPIEIQRGALRQAIRERRKLTFSYCSKAGDETERTVRPLLLSFYGAVWSMTSWCELRADFRTFRLDFIRAPRFLETHFEDEPGKRLADLMARPTAQR
ncbi:MAG: helix-turn-helix transcriptional regulator [Paracoccaceae bacterium]